MAVDVARTCVSKESLFSNLLTDEILLDVCATAPSPLKDFYQLIVTVDEVILRWWKVTCRRNIDSRAVAPRQLRFSHQDFIADYETHSNISVVFGAKMLDYVTELTQGHLDYLPRLPEKVLLKIMSCLPLESIVSLGQVSKLFQQLSQSNKLWEQLYIMQNGAKSVSPELRAYAKSTSWKSIYFTNKLHLKVQMRRFGPVKSGISLRSPLQQLLSRTRAPHQPAATAARNSSRPGLASPPGNFPAKHRLPAARFKATSSPAAGAVAARQEQGRQQQRRSAAGDDIVGDGPPPRNDGVTFSSLQQLRKPLTTVKLETAAAAGEGLHEYSMDELRRWTISADVASDSDNEDERQRQATDRGLTGSLPQSPSSATAGTARGKSQAGGATAMRKKKMAA